MVSILQNPDQVLNHFHCKCFHYKRPNASSKDVLRLDYVAQTDTDTDTNMDTDTGHGIS